LEFIHSPDTINDFKVDKADFTRQASLSFPIVVSTILHLFKETVEFNLTKILQQPGNKIAGAAAFSAARYKIKPAFFQALNALVVKHIETLKLKPGRDTSLLHLTEVRFHYQHQLKLKKHLVFFHKQPKAPKPVWHRF